MKKIKRRKKISEKLLFPTQVRYPPDCEYSESRDLILLISVSPGRGTVHRPQQKLDKYL